MIRRREESSRGWGIKFPGFDADDLRGALALRSDRSDRKGRVEDAGLQYLDNAIADFESLHAEKGHLGSRRDWFSQKGRFMAIPQDDGSIFGKNEWADKWRGEMDPVLRLVGNQLQASQIIDAGHVVNDTGNLGSEHIPPQLPSLGAGTTR